MLLDLQEKAGQDLRFIREAMERVEGVSSVSGLGGMLMGIVAVGATAFAVPREDLREQLMIWIYAAFAATVLGAGASWRKGARGGATMHWDPIRRFLLCLVPVILVAVALTWRLWDTQALSLVPSIWLMLYGCGVLAAGTYAINAVLNLGACFVILGVVSLFLPVAWSNYVLGLGFGGLHLVFGWWVYRNHGG